jgi:hypothetical protein
MKLVPAAGVWQLIDEAAPPGENLIAVLRGPVEVLAVRDLCEHMLQRGRVAAEFAFTHDGRSYRARPYCDRGNRLSLRIDGDDGSLSRVETEFAWPAGE